jgi:hypothetical protein
MSEGETHCLYCDKHYKTPRGLRRHIERHHPNTHAFHNVNLSEAPEYE